MSEDELKKLWHDALESIRVVVSQALFQTWFKDTYISRADKVSERYNVEIGVGSGFAKQTLESRYFGLIQDTLSKLLAAPVDMVLIVQSAPKVRSAEEDPFVTPLFQNSVPQKELLEAAILRCGLRRGFTFANYAVSSSNQMAWAASDAIARAPGNAYNPLFIWGGVGVGKTHLMHAVGHSMLEKDTSSSIYICTGEQFTNDIVEGIRSKSTQAVRNKYRRLQGLFIDDIQFIAGKDAIQEEFFHTFNALTGTSAQIILTSDRPPSEIAKLEDRLRSRFEAGLIVDIAPPDFELRCAILQIKAKEKGIDLPMDLVHMIAGNADSARKMEGVLTRLITEVQFKGKEVNMETIESIIDKGVETDNKTRLKVTPDDLVMAVAKYYSVGKRALMGDSRARPIARPRQILMYLMRTQLELPLTEVGRLVGGRDHTTVMHAVDKIAHLASDSGDIRVDIEGIKRML